jgi:ribulose-bisphosphate carboxylase large chain
MNKLQLSGERFEARYRIAAAHIEVAAERAEAICLEQTVEFPRALIGSPAILEGIVGRVVSLSTGAEGCYDAVIAYPWEAAGGELTQLLNVLFGNISIQTGVRLSDFTLSPALAARYRGPRLGIDGLRALTGVDDRPLLCTALKPMGLTPRELADLAYRLALGGIDLIKDDHGLSDQPFCPFEERVGRCAQAVERANRETGGRALYLPNVTAPHRAVEARARLARDAGAGGLLFCPGLAGLDTMRTLADDDSIALPILAHPAFQGSYAVSPHAGLSQRVLYGRLNRIAGADATIFPSYGGRFAYSPADCREIVIGATDSMGALAPIFPVPAGGMRLSRIAELISFYGRDCIVLIGGDLHSGHDDLQTNCARFRRLAKEAAAALPTSDKRAPAETARTHQT